MTLGPETNVLYLRINPKQIHFLKFLLEGYDGLAILSTVNAAEGLVLVRYPEHATLFLFGFLTDVCQSIMPSPV